MSDEDNKPRNHFESPQSWCPGIMEIEPLYCQFDPWSRARKVVTSHPGSNLLELRHACSRPRAPINSGHLRLEELQLTIREKGRGRRCV